MKMLILTPFLPYARARSGCPRAVFDRLRLLAPTHDLTVVALAEPHETAQVGDLERLGSEVLAVAREPAARRGGVQLWRRRARLSRGLLLGKQPVLVQEFYSRRAQRLIRHVLGTRRFDVVIVEHILMAQYLDGVKDLPPVVLSEHDVRLACPEVHVEQPPGLGPRAASLLRVLDRRQWSRYEARVCRQVAAVTVPTADDARVLGALVPGLRPQIVPFGLTPVPAESTRGSGQREPDRLLFVGNFTHAPNVDAAIWLRTQILPLVRRHRPAVRLWLVGKDPPPSVQALAGDGVQVTGEVPSVEPYLDRCTLFVAPLRHGGGVRMKVIEALAAGAPVVATTLGARGLNATAGRHLLIADNTQDFATAIVGALDDPLMRTAMGAAGRDLVGDERRRSQDAAHLNRLLHGVARRSGNIAHDEGRLDQ